MGTCFAVQRLVPPKVLGVELIHKEYGFRAIKVSIGCQLYGISEKRKVQIGIEVNRQRTSISTRHAEFTGEVEVERLALSLR